MRSSRLDINRGRMEEGRVIAHSLSIIDDDLKLKHSFSCILSSPSKSGKTSFCILLLQNLDSLCSERESCGGIIWCYRKKLPFRNVRSCHQTPRITRAYRRTLVMVVVAKSAS